MREIKFRAWDNLLGFMGEVRNIDFVDKTIQVLVEDNEGYYFKDWRLKEVKIMQFTGLQDCNGVDIYEGDIVEISQTSSKEQETYDSKSEVVFVDGAFKLVFYDLADEFYLDLKDSTIDYVEVIGNIYENPELLEV